MLLKPPATSFVRSLFSSWVYAAGFLFTTVGCIYAMVKHLPWVTALSLLPVVFAACERAYHFYHELEKVKLALQQEQVEKQQLDQRLKSIASEQLQELHRLVTRATQRESFSALLETVDYISRLQNLPTSPFSLRRIVAVGETIYLAVKVPAEFHKHLRRQDRFALFREQEGAKHLIAILCINQLNEVEKTVFLKLEDELDQKICGPLWELARSTDFRDVKGYGVKPLFDVTDFGGKNMDEVRCVLTLLCDKLNRE